MMEFLREQWREAVDSRREAAMRDAAIGEVMGDIGFWVEDVEVRGHTITGTVVEGTGWRVIGSWDELRDAVRKGSYRSEGTYTTGEEGRTQFLSHPQRAMTWSGGAGRKWSPVALVEVDLADLPFRMLRSPEQWFPDDDDPTEGRVWPDVGTGLGIEGNIPLDRIKAVHLFSDGRIYESHTDWRALVSAKISKDAVRCTNAAFEAITGQCPSVEIIDGGHFLSLLKDAGFGYEVLGRVAPTVRALMVMPEYQSGSYYLFTSGHAMALVDGVLTDTEERGPDGRRIIGVYRITRRSPVTAALSDFERGDRVEAAGESGSVVGIRGQGNAFTKGYILISFDSDPDRPAWYPWREVRKVGKTAMSLPDFKRTDRDMSEKQFLSACKKILADVAKEMGFKGKLPEVVVQDLGGSSARSIDPGEMREFPNGAILVDPYDATNARQKDSGYSTFRIIAHEAIHALVQREMKSYAGSTQIITEGSAEILSVVYWAKNGPGYGGGGSKDLDAIHEQGYGWVGGDVALTSRINYPEYIVEVMRRAASKVGWDQKRIVAEVKRIAQSDRNGAIDWLRETSADFPLPGGMPKTAEGMLLWLVRGA